MSYGVGLRPLKQGARRSAVENIVNEPGILIGHPLLPLVTAHSTKQSSQVHIKLLRIYYIAKVRH